MKSKMQWLKEGGVTSALGFRAAGVEVASP